jgi:hypothetical protein
MMTLDGSVYRVTLPYACFGFIAPDAPQQPDHQRRSHRALQKGMLNGISGQTLREVEQKQPDKIGRLGVRGIAEWRASSFAHTCADFPDMQCPACSWDRLTFHALPDARV